MKDMTVAEWVNRLNDPKQAAFYLNWPKPMTRDWITPTLERYYPDWCMEQSELEREDGSVEYHFLFRRKDSKSIVYR
jgi:hypothetical protein